MATDFFIGESLVGDGNEVAHIDLIIGSKSGPAGTAFANALSNQKDGFSTLLAVVAPNLPAKPDAVLIIDADGELAPDALRVFDSRFAAGADVVQGSIRTRNAGTGASLVAAVGNVLDDPIL